jgi:hypothetical protein
MEHASDVLSPRPVQTPRELNLEKLAKCKTKKTRLSFKQGTGTQPPIGSQMGRRGPGPGPTPDPPPGPQGTRKMY